ncbi:hypothetical protein [Nostoc sp.]|uniref:hypothetical protein n=1 Tax=Nostoc sp. TaxID=1180 RepID=UPI002FF86AA4
MLIGANFSHAKAGLQRRWAICLVIVSFLLSGVLGFLWAFNGYLFNYNIKLKKSVKSEFLFSGLVF